MGGVEGVWVQSELLERVTAVRLVVVVRVVSTELDVVREACLFGPGESPFGGGWRRVWRQGAFALAGARQISAVQ